MLWFGELWVRAPHQPGWWRWRHRAITALVISIPFMAFGVILDRRLQAGAAR